MIGHVYIKGLIGNFEDEAGVTLKDVIMQVEAKKDSDVIHVHINSQGGCVDTGNAIAEYLSKQSKVITIAETLCASIATRIHLAVPLERRKAVQGVDYFLHNPLFDGISGNAKELREAADYLDPVQKELVSMYCKNTTASKEAIEGLMDVETSLTDEEAVALGFVSEIIPRVQLKAVAFRSNNESNNKLKLDMSTIKEQIAEGLAPILAAFKANEEVVKSMMVATDNGELSYASEGDLPEVGEAVTIEGEIAPEGVYTVEGIATISVDAEGNVTEVMMIEEDVEEDVEALKAKIVELEAAAVASAEALAAKEEEFKTEIDAQVSAIKEELVAFKATVGSDFTPKSEKKVFNKAKSDDRTPKQKMDDRKAEIKARKKK